MPLTKEVLKANAPADSVCRRVASPPTAPRVERLCGQASKVLCSVAMVPSREQCSNSKNVEQKQDPR